MEKYTIKFEEMEVEINEEDLRLEKIEQIIFEVIRKIGIKAIVGLLKNIDQDIFERGRKEYKSEGFKDRYLNLIFGTVYFKRRLYKKGKDHKYYLLDKEIGIDKGQRNSSQLNSVGFKMISNLSYRETGNVIEELTGVRLSHEYYRQKVKKAGEKIDKVESNIENWAEEIPSKEVQFMEYDGCWASLQKEKKKKTEVKVGLFYDGKEDRYKENGQGQKKLKNKHFYVGIERADKFRRKASLYADLKLGASSAENVIIGGDGAKWIKGFKDYYPEAVFQLDRHHLNEAITRNICFDKSFREEIRKLIKEEKLVLALEKLEERCNKIKDKENKERIKSLIGYIRENEEEIYGYLKIPEKIKEENGIPYGTGAIEGNIGKFFKGRIKGRGMSWSIKGLNNFVKVKSHVMSGTLEEILNIPVEEFEVKLVNINHLLPKRVKKIDTYEASFEASVPVLSGSEPYEETFRNFIYSKSEI